MQLIITHSGRNVRKKDARARRKARWFYVFISPWLIGFVLFSLIPLLFGFYISLTNYDGLNLSTARFLGFANYERAFGDRSVHAAIGRTLVFASISVPLNLTVSFILAFILTRSIRFKGLFRTLFYIPSIVPIVASTWIWKSLMDTNFGLINGFLSVISPGTAIPWLVDYPTEILILLSLWIGTGGAMVIFMAGLQGIPTDLEEAARVDGATLVQIFRHITFPLLTPVLFYQLILSLIFAFQILIEPILLSSSAGAGSALSGIPPRDNQMYLVNAFSQIFAHRRFGYGSALIWILFLFTLLLTILVFYTSRFWVFTESQSTGDKK
jgi:ABC-type sugar transport system permease subunit